MVVVQQFRYNFLNFRTYVGYQLRDSGPFFGCEVELHVTCHFLKLLEQFCRRRAQNVVDFVDLIEFVVAWKQRKERDHFEVDATDSPVVHLVIVIPVS